MAGYLRKGAYATAMGALFAFLQTGYFLQMEIYLTAAYPSFLTVTVAWLAGGAAGLCFGTVGQRGRVHVRGVALWMAVSLAAYYLFLLILSRHPFQFEYLPLYGAFIMLSGAQAGHFFRVNQALFAATSRLFFLENNGFVLGWIGGFFGFVMFGAEFHWSAPVIAGAVCLGTAFANRPDRAAREPEIGQ